MADDQDGGGSAGHELVSGLLETALVSVAGAVDPSGGVLTAFGSHLLANAGSDSAWRRADLDLWKDIIAEEGSERRREYEETQDDFKPQSLIIDWLQQELAQLREQGAGREPPGRRARHAAGQREPPAPATRTGDAAGLGERMAERVEAA